MNRRPARCLRLLLALSPALLPLWQILHYGVDIPFWDQFDDDLAGLHIKAHAGSLTFAELAAQHNEHRIVLPRLCYLALGRLTGGNVIAEMLATWALALATSLLLAQLLRRTLSVDTPDHPPSTGAWFLVNVLVFSPAQAENWLWGMGLANLMPMFWTTAAILAALSPRRPAIRLTLVIVACTAATLSSGNGMLSWVLAGAVLVGGATETGPRALRARSAAILVVAAAFVIAAYFWNLAPPHHRGGSPYGASLWGKLHYTIAFLGSPFAHATSAPPQSTAGVAGLALLALLGTCLARAAQLLRTPAEQATLRRALPWLAVAGFAVGSALIAAHARAKLGPEQATTSRYVSFALYLPAALVALVPLLAPWRLFGRDGAAAGPTVLTAGATALVLLSIAVVAPALRLSDDTRIARRRTRAVAAFSLILPGHPATTAMVFPDPEVAGRTVRGLDAIGYLLPRLLRDDDATRLAAPAPAGVDIGRLENAREIAPGQIGLTGWAALPPGLGEVDLVAICATDPQGTPRIVNIAPVDQARAEKEAELGAGAHTCGWGLHAPLANLLGNQAKAVITAWAYDGDQGTFHPLAGTVTLNR